MHHLGPREWVSDERADVVTLGEWEGKSEYYDGTPPALIPAPRTIGDPSCFQRGERVGLPIVSFTPGTPGLMMPAECYRKADLAFDTNVFDCRFQWYAAEIVRLAYLDVDDARTFALDYFGAPSEAFIIPAGGTFHPQGILVKRFGEAYLFMTGTQTPLQWICHGLTGLGHVTDYGAYFTGNWSELATQRALAEAVAAFGVTPPTRWLLCGHSWGGQIAFVAAAKILLGPSGATVDLLTMGMNKPGDSRLIDIVAASRQCHLVNRLDPVPFIPAPRVPRWVSDAMVRPMIGEWERFRHPRVLTSIGVAPRPVRLTDDMVEEGTLNGISVVLAQALVPHPGADHFIHNYVATIRAYCPHLIPLYPEGAEQPYITVGTPATTWPFEFNLRIRFGELAEYNVPLSHFTTGVDFVTWRTPLENVKMIALVDGDADSEIVFHRATLIYDWTLDRWAFAMIATTPFGVLGSSIIVPATLDPFLWEFDAVPAATITGPDGDVTRSFNFKVTGPRLP